MERSRDDLYSQFIKSITSSSETPFFDESDLVEIFDYAGDQNDDAVRTEVLALAARLYPESDAFKVRKALYYYMIEREEMARALVDSEHEPNPIWDILALRLDRPSGDEVDRRLQAIVDRYPRMDDEAIIQFVDAANNFSKLDWVIEHIDQLKTKSNYQPTLLYEVAVMSSLLGDSATVIRFVDELTAIEPFYAPYWIMLARAYGEQNKLEEALNAIDYALAIDSSLAEALAVKVQLMLLMDKDINELIPEMTRLAEKEPDNVFLIRTLGLAITSDQGDGAAREFYLKHLKQNRGSSDLLMSYLEVTENPDRKVIEEFYAAREDISEDEGLRIARHLWDSGHYKAMAMVLNVFHSHEGLKFGFEDMVVAMYLAQDWRGVKKLLEAPGGLYTPNFSPMVSLAYTLSLLRLGYKNKAAQFIEIWRDNNASQIFSEPADRVKNTGVRYYMMVILERINEVDDDFLARIDPLIPTSPDLPHTF